MTSPAASAKRCANSIVALSISRTFPFRPYIDLKLIGGGDRNENRHEKRRRHGLIHGDWLGHYQGLDKEGYSCFRQRPQTGRCRPPSGRVRDEFRAADVRRDRLSRGHRRREEG